MAAWNAFGQYPQLAMMLAWRYDLRAIIDHTIIFYAYNDIGVIG